MGNRGESGITCGKAFVEVGQQKLKDQICYIICGAAKRTENLNCTS